MAPFKKHELDDFGNELYRVLKPGARCACSEYLLSPHFDWNNKYHTKLHKSFLPTLAATQSLYAADVCTALERLVLPLYCLHHQSVAWPLGEQKRNLIWGVRGIVWGLESISILPEWVGSVLSLLQKGGPAWTDAENAKIADPNWRIVAEKPENST